MPKIVVDTSIIINGQIIKQIESGQIKDSEIIIPIAVLDELQSQASQKREQGFVGLVEIKKLKEFEKEGISIRFDGVRPSLDEIRLADRGRI
ncbi:MAG: PIN domain-containing protein, partial [Thermoproteota archaeon]